MDDYQELQLRREIQKAIDSGDRRAELEARRSLYQASIDRETGAPAGIRSIVGPSSRKPGDRLSTLRKYFPDAQPFEGDNFIYTDPKTRKPTLFNPTGLDVGDVAEQGRMAAEMVGGAGGAMIGTGAAPGPGTVAGAGAGATLGGTLFDLGMNFLTPRVDTRATPEILTDQAKDFAFNAAGQKLGDAVAGVGGLVRSKFLTNPGAAGRLADFEAAGVPLEGAAAAVSGSRPIAAAQEALSWIPASSRGITDSVEKTVEGMSHQADELARRYAGGDVPSVAGASEMLEAGSKKAADKFEARQLALYEDFMSKIGEGTPVHLDHVKSLYDELSTQYRTAPKSQAYLEPAIKELGNLVDDAGGLGTMEFKTLRSVLTDIGQRLKDPQTVTGYAGKSGTQLKRVYGAVTADIENAARAAGPDAMKALETHRRYVRTVANEYLPVLDQMNRREADKVFKFAMEGSKDGPARLRSLKKNYSKEDWGKLAGTVIERMGKAPSGGQDAAGEVFSPATFLTRWNDLNPEARQVLFGSNPELMRSLDRLARVTASMKKTAGAINTSRTAIQNLYIQILTGGASAFVDPVGPVVSTVLPWRFGKVMTSPKFVRWLAKIPEQTANTWQGHLARLGAIAASEPDMQKDILQFQEELGAIPIQ